MMLTDLPKDILRLLILEVDNPRGYHGLICSSKLFHQLGKEVIERKKDQFRRVIIRSKHNRIITRQVLPNGKPDGFYLKYEGDILQIECSYVNGCKDGLEFEWSLWQQGQLVNQSCYKQDRLQWKETFRSNGKLKRRDRYEDGFFQTVVRENYYSDGTLDIQKSLFHNDNLIFFLPIIMIAGLFIYRSDG